MTFSNKLMDKISVYPMLKLNLIIAMSLTVVCTVSHAENSTYSAFKCSLHDGGGNKGDLNWWENTYSGYRWIACHVEVDEIKITNVSINGGNCFVTNNWFLNRSYRYGEVINISHSCLDPVEIELYGNGKTSHIKFQ